MSGINSSAGLNVNRGNVNHSAVTDVNERQLSKQAEALLNREGSFLNRVVTFLRGRLNLLGGQKAMARDNHVIAQSFFEAVEKKYGTAIAREKTLPMLKESDGGWTLDRKRVNHGFSSAERMHKIVRVHPEVQQFLSWGDKFPEIARKAGLTENVETIKNYERNLINYVVAEDTKKNKTVNIADKLPQMARLAAESSSGLVRTSEPKTDYKELATYMSDKSNPPREVGNFRLMKMRGNVFIEANKMDLNGRPVIYSNKDLSRNNNKIHISLAKEDMSRAWTSLEPLLFSDDNPFNLWKFTNLEGADKSFQEEVEKVKAGKGKGTEAELRHSYERVIEGAQITLYPYSDDSSYAKDGPKFRRFINLMEQALTTAGVGKGKTPETDLSIDGLTYATFRNDRVGTRGAAAGEGEFSEEMREGLRQENFFKALNQ